MTGPRLHSTSAANALLVLSLGVAALVLARTMGPTAFGDYSLAITLASVAMLVLTAGTGVPVKLLYDHLGDKAFPPYALVSLLSAALTLLVLIPITAVFQGTWGFGLAVGVYGFTSVLARQSADGFHALGRSERAITLTAAAAVLNTLAILALATLQLLTPTSAVVVAAVSMLVPFAAFLRAVRPRTVWPFPTAAHKQEAAHMVRLGLPTLGNSLGLVVLQRADRLVLAAFSGASALGVYAVAAGLGELARLAPTSIGQVGFYRASRNDLKAQRRLRLLGVVLAAAIAVAMIAAAPLLIPWLFGPEYESAVSMLQILALGEVVFALSFVDSRLLLGRGAVGVVGLIGVIAAVVGVIVYLVLVPPFAGIGAAWGSVVNYALLSIMLSVAYARSSRRIAMQETTARDGGAA